jgi:hypothetical protein
MSQLVVVLGVPLQRRRRDSRVPLQRRRRETKCPEPRRGKLDKL